MALLSKKIALSALLCAGPLSNVSADAQGINMRNVTIDAGRRAQQSQSVGNLDDVARTAEARINASPKENIALRHAATPDELRAILLRNGFTAKQLKAVGASKQVDDTVYAEGADVPPIKIGTTCCPSKLVISW